MYGIGGERRLDERELEWLPGFEGSRPVRVGNAASTQLQLDVYGEVLDAAYQTLAHGVDHDDIAWSLTRVLLEWLEDGWRQRDAGIWEVRGPARHFTHSKVMAWVAFDRAVRMHEEFGAAGPVERWRALRDEIHAEVLARAWSDGEAVVHPVLRLRRPRRELAADAVGRLPPADRPAVRLDRRGDPARADGRRPGPALPAAPGRRGGRHRGGRGRVPALLVLARRRAGAAGPARRGA